MIYSLVTVACGLLVPTPAVQQYVMPAAAAVQPSVSAQSLIFPTANLLAEGGTSIVTSFDDELDKMAAIQSQKDAQIDAYRAQQRAKQEAEEAAKAAEYEQAAKKAEERRIANEALVAAQKVKAAERAAAIAEEKAAAAAAKAAKYGAPAVASKPSKYGTVEKVSARSERIAARKAAGEEAPTLFGIGGGD